MNAVLRKQLIAAGVKNLQEFGYPTCNETNILTDYVFKKFFLSMLKENKGIRPDIDKEIKILEKEIG